MNKKYVTAKQMTRNYYILPLSEDREIVKFLEFSYFTRTKSNYYFNFFFDNILWFYDSDVNDQLNETPINRQKYELERKNNDHYFF